MIRILLLAVCATPLAGCLSYTETASPTPIVIQQQPPTGTVVVQPN